MPKLPYKILSRFFGEFIKDIASSLPLSLVIKFSDGKLSADEIRDLAQEIANIAARTLTEVYQEENKKKLPTPELEVKQ